MITLLYIVLAALHCKSSLAGVLCIHSSPSGLFDVIKTLYYTCPGSMNVFQGGFLTLSDFRMSAFKAGSFRCRGVLQLHFKNEERKKTQVYSGTSFVKKYLDLLFTTVRRLWSTGCMLPTRQFNQACQTIHKNKQLRNKLLPCGCLPSSTCAVYFCIHFFLGSYEVTLTFDHWNLISSSVSLWLWSKSSTNHCIMHYMVSSTFFSGVQMLTDIFTPYVIDSLFQHAIHTAIKKPIYKEMSPLGSMHLAILITIVQK